MIIARPLGVLRSLLFFSSFVVARIPIWFIIIAAFVNGYISSIFALYLILGIVICRGYLESEIAGSGFLLFTALRIYRFFATVIGILAVYGLFIYFGFGADNLDKALIALALIISVYLFYGRDKETSGYWQGYSVPTGSSFVTTLLWLYISFVPDSLIGNISILCAIYLIEFYIFYNGSPLTKLPVYKGDS